MAAAEAVDGQQVCQIPIDLLRPRKDQPRQHYDEEALQELADSIRSQGVRTPLTVRRVDGYYEILGGHRRRKAAVLAGLTELPCIIHEGMTDAEAREVVLLDNLQREDFLAWEEGAGYAEIVAKDGKSIAEVAQVVGKSPAFVQRRIDVHEKAGQALRHAHLQGLSLGALELIARDLSKEPQAAKECPRCGVILAGDVDTCTACGADCRQVILCPATDLQAVAAKKCKEKPQWQVEGIVQQVAERYGLSDKPVQTGFGFDVQQVAEEVLAVKTELEYKLERVGLAREWAVQNRGKVREYPAEAKEALRQQLAAAHAALRDIEEALS